MKTMEYKVMEIRIKKTKHSDTINRHSSIINLVPACPGRVSVMLWVHRKRWTGRR